MQRILAERVCPRVAPAPLEFAYAVRCAAISVTEQYNGVRLVKVLTVLNRPDRSMVKELETAAGTD